MAASSTSMSSFWNRLLHGDLGPSFGAFPTSVNDVIGNSIWWTVGLLGTTTIIAWLLGLILGSLAGYFPKRWWSEGLEKSLVVVYPVPYYILAFVLLILFTYYLPIFPLVGGGQGVPRLTLDYIGSILYHSFLPAVSIVIGATGISLHRLQSADFNRAIQRLRAVCRTGCHSQT